MRTQYWSGHGAPRLPYKQTGHRSACPDRLIEQFCIELFGLAVMGYSLIGSHIGIQVHPQGAISGTPEMALEPAKALPAITCKVALLGHRPLRGQSPALLLDFGRRRLIYITKSARDHYKRHRSGNISLYRAKELRQRRSDAGSGTERAPIGWLAGLPRPAGLAVQISPTDAVHLLYVIDATAYFGQLWPKYQRRPRHGRRGPVRSRAPAPWTDRSRSCSVAGSVTPL